MVRNIIKTTAFTLGLLSISVSALTEYSSASSPSVVEGGSGSDMVGGGAGDGGNTGDVVISSANVGVSNSVRSKVTSGVAIPSSN